MDVFVARQPIFDVRRDVWAYELLFRSGPENFFSHADADDATHRVIDTAFHAFGLETLSAGKRLFINLTRRVLLDDLMGLFPPGIAVAEVLETVEADPEVLAALQSLKSRGYLVALDDFVFGPRYAALVPLADIIKVDFKVTLGAERAAVVERLGRPDLKFLAEKVETLDEFEEARAAGYSLFQGYFFARPQMVGSRNVAPTAFARLRLMRDLMGPDIDFDALERTVKSDLALPLKLLRYLNSPAFGWRARITSIKHALVLLGDRQFRQWAALTTMTLLKDDQSPELVTASLVRARFCEQLAIARGRYDQSYELFLAGLLASLDALLNKPLPEILDLVGVPQSVREALLFGRGPLSDLYAAVRAYEQGDWSHPALLALTDDAKSVARAYAGALRWAQSLG